VIDFYYWPTPNGWKVSIMLEETALPYTLKPVNVGAGDQFTPAFMSISPNARMPAIVDHDAPDGPLPVFESGAILIHLAEKSGQFMPTTAKGRKECLEWLFWQVGNLGPMAGQLSHFVNYAKSVQEGDHRYAHSRYAGEYNRCLGVLERRLGGHDYILDDYSIADMISWPWVLIAKPLGQSLVDFPNLSAWRERIKSRPAVQRGVDLGKELRRTGQHTDEARKILFGQTSQSLKG
jgi:GSH-dependent disulfide-bond oxidoreductase